MLLFNTCEYKSKTRRLDDGRFESITEIPKFSLHHLTQDEFVTRSRGDGPQTIGRPFSRTHMGHFLGIIVVEGIFEIGTQVVRSILHSRQPNRYRVDVNRIYTQTDTVHRDDLIRKQSAIVDGVAFMKALLHQMEWQRNTTLQNIRGGSVLNHRRVTFRWEEEDAVMERKTLRDINSADIRFSIQKHVALRWG